MPHFLDPPGKLSPSAFLIWAFRSSRRTGIISTSFIGAEIQRGTQPVQTNTSDWLLSLPILNESLRQLCVQLKNDLNLSVELTIDLNDSITCGCHWWYVYCMNLPALQLIVSCLL